MLAELLSKSPANALKHRPGRLCHDAIVRCVMNKNADRLGLGQPSGKMQGGLRLDSYDQLMRGSEDGAVIAPNYPERSTLLARVTLPTSDKRFMPAEGHPPLAPNQIAKIRAWIAKGASPTATQIAGLADPGLAPNRQPAPPLHSVPDHTGLLPEISQMQQAQGAKLIPLSARLSDGLILNTVDAPASFGDIQLTASSDTPPASRRNRDHRQRLSQTQTPHPAQPPQPRRNQGEAAIHPTRPLIANLSLLYLFNTSADQPTQNSACLTQ